MTYPIPFCPCTQPTSVVSPPSSPQAVAINMEPSPPSSPGGRPATSSLRMLFRPLFGTQAPAPDTPSSAELPPEQPAPQLEMVTMPAPAPQHVEAGNEVLASERGDVLVELRRQSSPSLVRSDSTSSL